MTSKKNDRDKPKKQRPGELTGEDHQLWERIKETVDPLEIRKKHVLDNDGGDDSQAERQKPAGASDPRKAGVRPPVAFKSVPPKKSQMARIEPAGGKHTSPPPLANFEPRKARRIRSGAISIEARIDLHGMRKAEAHSVLRSFLISSQARGFKWVLVITGKGDRPGAPTQSDIPFDDPNPQTERGVLRRNVPSWLGEPELRKVVVSYTAAASHHGGSGAIYVQLRSKRK